MGAYPSAVRRETLSEKERLPAESMATGSAERVMVEALEPAVMERLSADVVGVGKKAFLNSERFARGTGIGDLRAQVA